MANIEEIALTEAQKYHPVDDVLTRDDVIEITIANSIPTLTKDSPDPSWRFRQNGVLSFFRSVCAQCPELALDGKFVVGLHDSYGEELGILVFSKKNYAHRNTLIPDLYAMGNYANRLLHLEDINPEHKHNSALFIGASTGSLIPADNERLQTANATLDMTNVHVYINNIVQMQLSDVAEAYSRSAEFMHNTMDMRTQLQHKFLISIDGNTCAWDRVPWVLNSNSVLLKKKSTSVEWYYKALVAGIHYIEFSDAHELPAIIENSPSVLSEVLSNAHEFVATHLTQQAHMAYMTALLRAIVSARR